MGHLADRYRDASRSGVYRVTDGAVPQAAALEAGVALARIALANGVDARAVLREKLAAKLQVLIVEGLDAIAADRPDDWRALLALLHSAARARRALGVPFFAVLVDPRQTLALSALYKERR